MNGTITDIEEIKLMIPYKTHAKENIYFLGINWQKRKDEKPKIMILFLVTFIC